MSLSPQFITIIIIIIIIVIIIILFIIQGTRRGWERGVLSPRVPKVRRKGPCSPAIFRNICSVILGPRKLAADRISVHFMIMHLMETTAWINMNWNWIAIKINLKSQLRLTASNVAGFSKRSHSLVEADGLL